MVNQKLNVVTKDLASFDFDSAIWYWLYPLAGGKMSLQFQPSYSERTYAEEEEQLPLTVFSFS